MPAEDRFLKSRLEREALRASKAKDEGAIEQAQVKEDFNAEVKALGATIADLLSGNKLDEASEKCRELQQLITSANETMTLPSHEQRSLNTMLSSNLTMIADAKAALKPAKKFGFSSKAKLVTTTDAVAADFSTPAPMTTTSSSSTAADAMIGKEESTSGEVFADLENANIFIPMAKAVFVRRCRGCTIFALPTAGSLFLSDCVGCVVYCAPHQLRIKSCMEMSLYTWCTSRPVIESCDQMRFGGYDAWKGLLSSAAAVATSSNAASLATHEEWVTAIGAFRDLAWATSSYTQVDDFHWLKQAQSPHWSLIPKDEWVTSDVTYVTATKSTAAV